MGVMLAIVHVDVVSDPHSVHIAFTIPALAR